MNFKHTYVLFILYIFAIGCDPGQKPAAIQQTGKKAGIPKTASIQWIDSLINLGKIRMGDEVLLRFRFRNNGKEPLLVQKIETSCSCTAVEQINNAIPAGGEGEIRAVFDTRKSIVGFVGKAILVTTNTLPASKQLLYHAEITGHKQLR